MRHVAQASVFVTPSGTLGERYECSCGRRSTAAECHRGVPIAETAMFGGGPCAAIMALHRSGREQVEYDDTTGKAVAQPDSLDRADGVSEPFAI